MCTVMTLLLRYQFVLASCAALSALPTPQRVNHAPSDHRNTRFRLKSTVATVSHLHGPVRHKSRVVPPRIEWARGYSFAPYESHPHAGVELADGGFLMVGDGVDYSHSNPLIDRLWFAQKVTAVGDIVWQVRFGDVGFNYGKFGIELPDSTLLLAGALSVNVDSYGPILHRAVLRLSQNGTLLQKLVLDNMSPELHLRDGFMGIALSDSPANSVFVTGFVGGENATAPGYVDEPMFLIKRGRAVVARINYDAASLNLAGEAIIDPGGQQPFAIYQGMRVVYDAPKNLVVVSHTVSYDNGGNIQMGMSGLSPSGELQWTRGFPAQHGRLTGHASHPYALTMGTDGHYVIGGLAVLFDESGIERCQGRMLQINETGDVVWDSRFNSLQRDTNIECYGVVPTQDGGFAMTCGAGVEPELHPHDPPQLKTWMVLLIRTDASGALLYQQNMTDNTELKSNAGEFIVARRRGGYAIYVDSKGTYGPSSTGGNFALMALTSDTAQRVGE